MEALKLTATDTYLIAGIIAISEIVKRALGPRVPRRLVPLIPVLVTLVAGIAVVVITEAWISPGLFVAKVLSWATMAMGAYSLTKTTVLGKTGTK
ncbi:MAG: hypothetical protein HPY52_10860 [Firmicutes bacterium]|nr:hypothetical protein [Bacillota bacterium]